MSEELTQSDIIVLEMMQKGYILIKAGKQEGVSTTRKIQTNVEKGTIARLKSLNLITQLYRYSPNYYLTDEGRKFRQK